MKKPGTTFVTAFKDIGSVFSYELKLNLPKVAFLDQGKAAHARLALKKAADTASNQFMQASRDYLHSRAIQDAVMIGQKRGAADIGVQFGGVNERLVASLRHDMARDLAKVANSPNSLVNDSLRRATLVGKQISDSLKTRMISEANEKISQSLLTGTLSQELYGPASKRLLNDLGLAEGDKAIFLSGYRMDAEDYAKLLVRTRTMDALNQGKANEYLQNGYLFIETSEHDGVDPKDICYFLQGKVWALAPNDQGIPLLPQEYGLPPWHPNCVHTFGAWQPQFEGGQSAVDDVIDSHEKDDKALSKWDGKTYQPASKA